MVLLFDADVVVAPANIEFRKEGFALKAFNDVADKRKGVIVADSPFVQGSVVHDGAELATLLLAVK